MEEDEERTELIETLPKYIIKFLIYSFLYRFLKNDNSGIEEMIINLNQNVNQLKGKAT